MSDVSVLIDKFIDFVENPFFHFLSSFLLICIAMNLISLLYIKIIELLVIVVLVNILAFND
ncbi:hypothetical protein MARINON1_51551 [Marinobacter salarius]|nr:hypothetical protein MBHK15_130060 [Marinobacter salarius]VXB89584.1 hypothetical protein MARINON1_51551 [Marinobacter salarius]